MNYLDTNIKNQAWNSWGFKTLHQQLHIKQIKVILKWIINYILKILEIKISLKWGNFYEGLGKQHRPDFVGSCRCR